MSLASRNQFRAKYFSARTSLLSGRILELGVGYGRRATLYNTKAEVIDVDVIFETLRLNRDTHRNDDKVGLHLFSVANGLHLPFRSECFDAVVISFTLCSVIDQELVATELFRVAKPHARIIVLEHIRSPINLMAQIQEFLTPIYAYLFNNCHLNRNPEGVLVRSGFIIDEKALSEDYFNPWLYLLGRRKG